MEIVKTRFCLLNKMIKRRIYQFHQYQLCAMFRPRRTKRDLVLIFVVTLSVIEFIQINIQGTTLATLSSKALRSNQREHEKNRSVLPMIYAITPTKYRTEQRADLTRLSHTLRLVPRLHWIVIEDSDKPSKKVKDLLAKSRIPYTHLTKLTSDSKSVREKYRLSDKWVIPKGTEQRNLALEWITKNAVFPSVFYCCDDDNAYDLQVFEEMRYTKKVSVWPIGLSTSSEYESPVVKNGKVVDWASGWIADRKFPIDMAGFAINTHVLMRKNPPRFNLTVSRGFVEPAFLSQIVKGIDELEPKADNCSKVLAWHTKTKSASIKSTSKVLEILAKYNVSRIMDV